MNTLIFGSGFGLYGYLPAISNFSQKIFLNKKYKKKIISNKTLNIYHKKIIWFETLEKVIKSINYVVIAQTPKSQLKTLNKILKKKKNFNHIFLEKPISENPNKAFKFVKKINKENINYSFGFIFEYMNWIKFLRKKKNISIIWKIKKKNYSNSWKYKVSHGGGLIRFYGIHFLRLFYDLNYRRIKENRLSKKSWTLYIQNIKKNTIKLYIGFDNKEKFLIKNLDRVFLKTLNPFLKSIKKNKEDPRVNILKKYIRNQLGQSNIKKNHLSFIKFWEKVEKIN